MSALLVVGIVVLAGTSGGCVDTGPQMIEVDVFIVTEDPPDDEEIVPIEAVDDEITREAVREVIAAYERNGTTHTSLRVTEGEFQDPHFEEDGQGYVAHNGHVVRVQYWMLD